MSILKVNQIRTRIRSLFEAHLDTSDLSPDDKEREQKILSRCLAALAVYTLSGCEAREAAESVWDRSDDNGIDAAYFDPSDSRVIFVQSKWINKGSGEPEAKELGSFAKGVRDAIEMNLANFDERLQSKLSALSGRLNTPGTSVLLAVITTGASDLARHGQGVLDAILHELNGDDTDKIAESQVLGLTEAYSALVNDPLQGNLTLDATILQWSYVPTPFPAYFGMIDDFS